MKLSSGVGFLAVVALVLSGCGTAPPKTDEVRCPAVGYATTHFCLTPAEAALGQRNIHSPTIPDLVIIQGGITLTTSPADTNNPKVSEVQAAAIAVALLNSRIPKVPDPPNGPAHYNSAVLALVHDGYGNPAQGQLAWVVDVTPIGGIYGLCGGMGACVQPPVKDQFAVIVVNASTGAVIQDFNN